MEQQTGAPPVIAQVVSQELGAIITEWSVYFSMARRIFPLAKRQLRLWEHRARSIPNPELRRQALASIHKKSFHSVGGAVFALLNRPGMEDLIKAVVAIQTISDYLDNLCDRAVFWNPVSGCSALETAAQGFSSSMKLHEAMLCAVDPERPMGNFYSQYPAQDDGGYLMQLAATSQEVLTRPENYSAVKPLATFLTRLYSEMQSIKHLSPGIRDTLMEQWFALYSGKKLPDDAAVYKLSSGQPGFAVGNLEHSAPACFVTNFACQVGSLKWWEFGAAAGSTLAIFALIAYASLDGSGGRRSGSGGGQGSGAIGHKQSGRRSGHCIACAYFPPVCALHILLDYFIDQEEDRESGDLNFVSYYDSAGDAVDALNRFTCVSLEMTRNLPESWFHKAVIRGLLAMYFSDSKVRSCGLGSFANQLTTLSGARLLRVMCALTRAIAGI